MDIQLFLVDRELELSKEVKIPLNKTFEDLTNPTKIIVDYSKSINIPVTTHNNKVLGYAYRLDKVVLGNQKENIGIFLDPSKKIPFKLLYNNQLVLEGYAKFVSSTSSTKDNYYTLNLFGTLGDIIQNMMDVVTSEDLLQTDDPEDKKYVLDDMLSGRKLDRYYVCESWDLNKHDMRSITNGKPDDMKDTDIIGFAPAHRGQYNDFESDKIDNGTQIISLEEDLKRMWMLTYKDQHPGASDEEVEKYVDALKPGELVDNLCDYHMKEFRSYCMKPYIYIDKLFNMYQAKCKDLTGYDLVLDPKWFNNDNNYWSKVCYMLNYPDKDIPSYFGEIVSNGVNKLNFNELDESPLYSKTTYSIKSKNDAVIGNKTFRIDPFNINFKGKYSLKSSYYTNIKLKINSVTSYNVIINIYNNTKSGDHNLVHTEKFWAAPGFIGNRQGPYGPSWGTVDNYVETTKSYTKYDSYGITKLCDYGFTVTIPGFNYEGNVDGEWEMEILTQFQYPNGDPMYETEGPVIVNAYNNTSSINENLAHNIVDTDYISISPISAAATQVTDTTVKLRNFYKSEEPLFNVLLQYTKMFGLIWDIDYVSKTLTVMPRTSYFKNYKISNWDNKVDKGNNYTTSPITFDSKYINFNYEPTDGFNYSSYQKKYGVEYGAKRLKTTYEFDTQDKDLFEGINPSCISNRTYTTYDSMRFWDLRKTIPSELEPYQLIDDDDEDTSKSIELNNWFFRLPGIKIDPIRTIRITDDSSIQTAEGLRCWTSNKSQNATTYPTLFPVFSIVYPGEKGGINISKNNWVPDASPVLNHKVYRSVNTSGISSMSMNVKGYDTVKLQYKGNNLDGGDFLAITKAGVNASNLTQTELVRLKNDYVKGLTTEFNNIFAANTISSHNTSREFTTIDYSGQRVIADGISNFIDYDSKHIHGYCILTTSNMFYSTDGKNWTTNQIDPGKNAVGICMGNQVLAYDPDRGWGFFSFDGGKTMQYSSGYPMDYDVLIEAPSGVYMFSSKELKQPKQIVSIADATITDIFKPMKAVGGIAWRVGEQYYNVVVGPDSAYYGDMSNKLEKTQSIGKTIKSIARAYLPQVHSVTGRFVTVGNPGDFYYSDDGKHWEPIDYKGKPMYKVIEYGEGFIGFSKGGYLHRSADGINWTEEYSGIDSDLFDIINNPEVGVDVYVGNNPDKFTMSYEDSTDPAWGEVTIPIHNLADGEEIQVLYCIDPSSEHVSDPGGFVAIPELEPTQSLYADGITFNTPLKDFTSDKQVSLSKGRCIYDKFWKDYIDERYNIQNKKLTAFFDLKPEDYINLKFSDFVTLDNQLFHINKIYDYDLSSNNLTKIDLLQISDPTKYTGGDVSNAKCEIQFNVKQKDAIIKVNGTIITDGIYIGYIGELINVAISLDGYKTYIKTFLLKESMIIDVDLEVEVFVILFKSDVSKPVIEITTNRKHGEGQVTDPNKEYTYTLSGDTYKGVRNERFKYKVSKDNYTPIEGVYTIKGDATIPIMFKGEDVSVKFVSNQPIFDVNVNGEELIGNTYTGKTGEVIKYKATCKGFPDLTGQMTLEKNTEVNLVFGSKLYNINFSVDVPEYTIYINDELLPGNTYKGPLGQRIRYRVESPGKPSKMGNLEITKDETIYIKFLQSIFDITFKVNLSEYVLKVNDKVLEGNVYHGFDGEEIKYIVTANNCDPVIGSLTITRSETINIYLKPKEFKVTFKSDLPDTSLEINGSKIQPVNNNIYENSVFEYIGYKDEVINYVAYAPNKHEISGTLVITKNQNVNLYFNTNTYKLKFTSNIENTRIQIDDEIKMENMNFILPANNTYRYHAWAGESRPIDGEVYLDSDKTIPLTFAQQSYTLTFRVHESGVPLTGYTIKVDGNLITGDTYTGYYLQKVDILVEKEHYDPWHMTWVIRGDEVVDVNMRGEKALIEFDIDQPQSTLYINGEQMPVHRYLGTIGTTFEYRVECEGFNDIIGSHTITGPTTIYIDFIPRVAVTFDITPSDAKITIWQGDAPQFLQGNVYYARPGTAFSYKVERLGYLDIARTITVYEATTIKHVMELLLDSFTFEIKPQKEGTYLLSNGKMAEYRPGPDFWIVTLNAAEGETVSNWEAGCPGYITQKGTVKYGDIIPDRIIRVNLEPKPATITFDVDVSNYTIYVNDREIQGNIYHGKHDEEITYRVTSPGYPDITPKNPIIIKDGMHIRAQFKDPEFYITVNTIPIDATITTSKGRVEDRVVIGRKGEEADITVSKEEYESKTVHVVFDEDKTISVVLAIKTYPVKFEVDIPGYKIYVNGEEIFSNLYRGPKGESIHYKVVPTRPEYKTVEGDYVITGNNDIIQVSIQTYFKITWNINPKDAVLTINDIGIDHPVNNSVTAPVFSVISWKVSKPGYITKTGEHYVTKDEVINVNLERKRSTITFNIRSDNNIAPIENEKVYVNGKLIKQIQVGEWDYVGYDGEPIDWKVTCPGFSDKSGHTVVEGTYVLDVLLTPNVGTIKFSCSPRDCDVYVNGVLCPNKLYKGKIGETVKWRAEYGDKFYPASGTFTITQYNNLCAINLEAKDFTIRFDIDQSPHELYVNGEITSDSITVKNGDTIDYVVKCSGYPNKTGNFIANIDNAVNGIQTIYIDFEPRIDVTFDVIPRFATIYIEDYNSGRMVPISGDVYRARNNRTLRYEVRAEQYKTKSGEMFISEPTTITVRLEEELYEVKLEVTPLEHYDLYVDGVLQGLHSIKGRYNQRVSFTIKMRGYKDYNNTITILGNRTLYIDMVKVPDIFKFEIVSSPEGCIVYINGYERSVFEAEAGTRINWSVSKPGYITKSGDEILTKNKRIGVLLTPRHLVATYSNEDPVDVSRIEFESNVSNYYVFVDGKIVTSNRIELYEPICKEHVIRYEKLGHYSEETIIKPIGDEIVHMDMSPVNTELIEIEFNTCLPYTSLYVNGELQNSKYYRGVSGEEIEYELSAPGYLPYKGKMIVPTKPISKYILLES